MLVSNPVIGFGVELTLDANEVQVKKGIVYLSFFMLITANIISVAWVWNEGGFEPVITSILIFTAIIGFFVERWISTKQEGKNCYMR